MKSMTFQISKIKEFLVSLNPIAITIIMNSIHRKKEIP